MFNKDGIGEALASIVFAYLLEKEGVVFTRYADYMLEESMEKLDLSKYAKRHIEELRMELKRRIPRETEDDIFFKDGRIWFTSE